MRRTRRESKAATDAGAGVIPLAFIDNGAECVMEIAIQGYGSNEPWKLAGARHFTISPDRKISRHGASRQTAAAGEMKSC